MATRMVHGTRDQDELRIKWGTLLFLSSMWRGCAVSLISWDCMTCRVSLFAVQTE